MTTFQDYFSEKNILTELSDSDEKLMTGLKNHLYDIIIVHNLPNDKTLFCQRYMDEQIYISIANEHPISGIDAVTFEELRGLRILASANIGF